MRRLGLRPLTLVGLLGACTEEVPTPSLTTRELASPAGVESGEPFLSAVGDTVYLSWLERSEGGRQDLRFALFAGGAWTQPATIASSERFFVNWADFPSITPAPDGSLWAHWLERGEAGGYDYGIRVTHSMDGGVTWSEPRTPHEDGTATEHGFVSTVPVGDQLGFVWLDGRGLASGGDEMALYFRALGAGGEAGAETRIDARVCDCCQTDGALTEEGPVVVYRDRSPDEIRDIYVTRLVEGAWTEGRPVHADGWETGACPVNGPAVGAVGRSVAVAWFTAAEDVPRVKVAFSRDSGRRFDDPVIVDDGNPAGRVDLLRLDDRSALVSWLERSGGERAEVRIRHVSVDGRMGESSSVSASSSERASGFPRMALAGDGRILVAWTDVTGVSPQVRVATVDVGTR